MTITTKDILQELLRRKAPYLVIEGLYPKQSQVAKALRKSRKIAVRTSRRAGKSWLILSIMIAKCLRDPGSSCLYMALTHKSVNDIAVKTLFELLSKFNIQATWWSSRMLLQFDNGSVIFFSGAQSKNIAERFRGAKYDIAACDEAASFSARELHNLLTVVIGPTLMDRRGILILTGTPSPVQEGVFFDATTGKLPEWDVYTWDTFDNPAMMEAYGEDIEAMIAANPNIVNEPWFLREWRGEWAKDIAEQVYRYDPSLNLAGELPPLERYVLGVDFGWDDPCAFVVTGTAQYEKNTYVLESFKAPALTIDDIVAKLKYYTEKYPGINIVGDHNYKVVVEEIARRHGIFIQLAEKTDKASWIETMNSDFLLARIKIVAEHNADLIEELSKLVWSYNTAGKREETASLANHLCDGLLYNFRNTYAYLNPSEPEQLAWGEARKQKLMEATRRPNNNYWE